MIIKNTYNNKETNLNKLMYISHKMMIIIIIVINIKIKISLINKIFKIFNLLFRPS